MQISSINNNQNNTNFCAVKNFKVKGKDIKALPEEIKAIREELDRVITHPYYKGKDFNAVLQSRDYTYIPDKFATGISAAIDNVPRYSVKLELEEVANTPAQKIRNFLKKAKALFASSESQTYKDAQPYQIARSGDSIKDNLFNLLLDLKVDRMPMK